MIFLTRVLINALDVARLNISDRYQWHQILWKCFTGIPENTPQNFLYRIDQNESRITLWILSDSEPVPQYWGQWNTKNVSDTFLTHKKYYFSIAANPTVMRVVRSENGVRRKNGRRTAIYNENELKNWLERKGNDAGFIVNQVECSPPVKEVFYKKNKQGVLSKVDYSGFLTVTDEEKFRLAWINGIGPAKAFGFGLLLLQPVE